MVGGFSKGIKVAKIALENALVDYKVTVARTGEAARWKHGVADEWYEKGKEVCGSLLEESVGAIVKQKRERGPRLEFDSWKATVRSWRIWPIKWKSRL
jgi:hypothetical protein